MSIAETTVKPFLRDRVDPLLQPDWRNALRLLRPMDLKVKDGREQILGGSCSEGAAKKLLADRSNPASRVVA